MPAETEEGEKVSVLREPGSEQGEGSPGPPGSWPEAWVQYLAPCGCHKWLSCGF